MRAQSVDRSRPVAGADHLIAVIGPFQLTLQAFVILDNKQNLFGFIGHARFRCGSCAASAAGKVMVKVVPWPGRLSTPIVPPIAVISDRASNAPIPKPPGLLETKG